MDKTYISNLSLQEGVFPDELKMANVVPLFKCADPELFLTIIDQCLCYALCQRSLRESCTIGCEIFLVNAKPFFHINLDFVNLILHTWL